MSNYTISVVDTTSKSQLRKYADFPNKLYRDNPYYVPTLFGDDIKIFDREKNAAYEFCDSCCWLAYDEKGNIVGRIAAIINYQHEKHWGKKQGRFGFVDFIEDYEVAKLLLDTAREWLKQKGMESMIGPLGFCDMDPEGTLVDGFDKESTLTTIYNHPYYGEYFEKYGLTKDVDWFEYEMKVTRPPQVILDIAEQVKKRYKLSVYEPKSKKELKEKYGMKVFDLLNEAYAELYAVNPLSERQKKDFINQYLAILTKDYIKIIIDEKGELIAFGVGMPNLSSALKKSRGRLFPFGFIPLLKSLYGRPEVVDLLLIATKPDYQKKGVNALLLKELYDYAVANSISYFNLNPQLETNIKVRSGFKHFDIHQNKTRRSYYISLQ